MSRSRRKPEHPPTKSSTSLASTPASESSSQRSAASILSRKAASVKKAVKKGVKAITRPFKKSKHAQSTHSQTSSVDGAISVTGGSAPENADVVELTDSELDAEKELGNVVTRSLRL
jgi:hypothetical protein